MTFFNNSNFDCLLYLTDKLQTDDANVSAAALASDSENVLPNEPVNLVVQETDLCNISITQSTPSETEKAIEKSSDPETSEQSTDDIQNMPSVPPKVFSHQIKSSFFGKLLSSFLAHTNLRNQNINRKTSKADGSDQLLRK